LRFGLVLRGSPIAKTPVMDELASKGLLFNRAYCQQAICRPSRASLMTGTRPETTGLFHNYVSLRELQPDVVTLPQHFIANGYEAAYSGKIFHRGDTDEGTSWRSMAKPRNVVWGTGRLTSVPMYPMKRTSMATTHCWRSRR